MIELNGVYEGDNGARIYILERLRGVGKWYRVLFNQPGTKQVYKFSLRGDDLKDCKYLGQARCTWEDLFQIYSITDKTI